MGIYLPLRRAVTGYFVAQVVNQTLPGGIPGDVARAVRSRGQGGRRVAAGAVVAGRPAGQIALVALMIPAMALSRAAGHIDRPPVTGWGLAILTALAGPAMMLQLPASVTPLRVPCKPDVRPGQAVLGVTIVVLNLAAFACAARATGTALSPEALVTLVPLILTAMLVPLSIGG